MCHKINFHILSQLKIKETHKESPRNLMSVSCLLRNLIRKISTWTITLSPGPLYTCCVCLGTYVKASGWHSLWKFLFILLKKITCVCSLVAHTCPLSVWRSEENYWQLCSATLWILGIECRPLVLPVGGLTWWTTLWFLHFSFLDRFSHPNPHCVWLIVLEYTDWPRLAGKHALDILLYPHLQHQFLKVLGVLKSGYQACRASDFPTEL